MPNSHLLITRQTLYPCPPSLTVAYGSTLYYIVRPIYQCPHRSQTYMEVCCIILCIIYQCPHPSQRHMEVHCSILCIQYIKVPIALSRIWKYTVLYCASHISMSPSLTAAYGSTLYSIVHLIYQCLHRSQPHMEVHCIL